MSRSTRPRSFGERRKRVGEAGLQVVNPLWPLLAFMLGGVWLAWPWMLLNEAWMKSDDLRRQIQVVVLGLAGSFVIALAIMKLVEVEVLSIRQARYVAIVLLAWKLGISYVLHTRQSRTWSLWEYFGGKPRNGLWVLIAGVAAAPPLFDALPFGVLWLVLR